MKKTLKFMTLLSFAFILAACSPKSTPTSDESAESVESSMSVEESTSDKSESPAPVGSQESAEVASSVKEETVAEEPTEDSVVFKFYVTGEDEPFAEYFVNDADGQNILDTMISIKDLTFNFNEDEGVIDEIEDYVNDYAAGQTWTYLLNGEYAELGVVSQHLEKGDEVKWYFGHADEIPMNLVPVDEVDALDEVEDDDSEE